MITLDTQLPTYEQLDVEEIELSGPALKAGAFHFGKFCEHERDHYVLCRGEERDARRCLQEGKAVTACALRFFRQVKQLCRPEFDQYVYCVNNSSPTMDLFRCRESQKPFDQCMMDKMQLERPYYGYFCLPKVVKTDRPIPKRTMPDFKADAVPQTRMTPESDAEAMRRYKEHRQQNGGF